MRTPFLNKSNSKLVVDIKLSGTDGNYWHVRQARRREASAQTMQAIDYDRRFPVALHGIAEL